MRTIKGKLFETGERVEMRANGYWIGAGGRHITSYERVDKQEEDFKQYSMDRKHNFYLESVN